MCLGLCMLSRAKKSEVFTRTSMTSAIQSWIQSFASPVAHTQLPPYTTEQADSDGLSTCTAQRSEQAKATIPDEVGTKGTGESGRRLPVH